MIECRGKNLIKKYDGVPAVDSLSFELEEGKILAVLGPSGCGKSTLLRLISGLLRPDSGELYLNGKCVSSCEKGIFVPPERRRISLMFQSYALWPDKTVYRNVAYPLVMHGVKKEEIPGRVADILDLVHLASREGAYPHELSGGERQRVALARSLVMRPSLLLLDEPFSNLDAKLRENMQYELRRLRDMLNLTIIHVTHDQAEAMAIADEIAVMNRGRIVERSSPRKLFKSPRSLFAARFIGRSNIFTVGRKNKDVLRRLIGDECVTGSFPRYFMVRPHEVDFTGPGEGVEAVVSESLYRGEFTEYHLECGEQKFKAEIRDGESLVPGTRVNVSFRNFVELYSCRAEC